jgi:hypothetical protein
MLSFYTKKKYKKVDKLFHIFQQKKITSKYIFFLLYILYYVHITLLYYVNRNCYDV